MNSLLCVNTGGEGDLHGVRMRRLTKNMSARCTYVDFDRSQSRWANARELWRTLRAQRWDLVYQESTGIAGGLCLVRAARAWGQRYVVSSGDPVGGFFRAVKGKLWGAAFECYERLLYRHSTGFIGWTPYLTGAAMKMGAPRAVTVEGAVDTSTFSPMALEERRRCRAHYGLPSDHLVCGVVGSLTWTPRQQYCYGLELVELLSHLERDDVSVLIVGDGDGRTRLEARVPEQFRERVVFTGRVPEAEVAHALGAMDIGFITQTMDSLGRYRLTTKLPEYLAAGLPVAMSPIPGFYDYAQAAGWALPAHHPASEDFHRACAAWLDGLHWEEVQARRERAPALAKKYFDYEVVRPTFEAFVEDVLADGARALPGRGGSQDGSDSTRAHQP
jgi:glycosyltransferase involved in cell wall biosynthesis